jgi:hypothetical protein
LADNSWLGMVRFYMIVFFYVCLRINKCNGLVTFTGLKKDTVV